MIQKNSQSKVDSSPQENNGNKWTVMIYMAGDNTLAGESIWAITEILAADINDGVEVIVFFDTSPPEVPNRRFVFRKGASLASQGSSILLDPLKNKYEPKIEVPIKSDATQKLGNGKAKKKEETLMVSSDYRLLQRFVEDCIDQHPAENYLLVLSGHGSGAIGDFLTSERPAGNLSIPKLKEALKGKQIDVLGMDSCLMSMAEVAYELRGSVGLLVGSEGFEPETGWPYRQILSELKSDASDIDVAKTIVSQYIEFYRKFVTAGLSVDQAICDLTKLDPLTAALKDLAEKMAKKLSDQKVQDAIILAHWKAQSYKSEQYTDLWDFCDWLERKCPKSEKDIIRGCKRVRSLIESDKDRVVRGADYYGPSFQNSHGLSIFFPWKNSGSLEKYCKDSPFAKKTGWGDFLLKYVQETQVERRGESRDGKRKFDTEKYEPIEISAIETSSVIPALSDFPAGNRQPPGGDRQPPGGDRGLSKQGVMKNPPRYFLRNRIDKKAVR